MGIREMLKHISRFLLTSNLTIHTSWFFCLSSSQLCISKKFCSCLIRHYRKEVYFWNVVHYFKQARLPRLPRRYLLTCLHFLLTGLCIILSKEHCLRECNNPSVSSWVFHVDLICVWIILKSIFTSFCKKIYACVSPHKDKWGL